MSRLQRTTVVDQTVDFLAKGIRKGRWAGRLPGAIKLSQELDVSKDTVMAALEILESEGWVVSRGIGRAREVAPGAVGKADLGASPAPRMRKARLRVGILPYEDPHHSSAFKQRQLLSLAHEIESAGYTAFFAPRSQMACKGDVARIGAMVKSAPADVWIVMNGLQEMTGWFRSQRIPFFAIGGRTASGMPASAYCPTEAMRGSMRRLISLGHRRIILVCPRNWRLPETGPYVHDFLSELKEAGIPAGEYNVPDWTETPAGFVALLRALFSITPPTALIVGDARQAMAVATFLSSRGLRVGRDVSLVVRVPDPTFEWTEPTMAHFAFDEELIVRRAVRWLADFSKGRGDSEVSLFPMVFVDGATVGPVGAA